jgi:cellulose synthase/poly-beta-1,6-N-acetylglucosamine synthase-like glycosyltransferase
MHAGLDFVDLDAATDPVDDAAAALVSAWVAREYGLLPVEIHDGVLVVAIATPGDTAGIQAVAALSGRQVRPIVAAPDAIRRAQDRVYGVGVGPPLGAGGAEALPPEEERRRAIEAARRAGRAFVSLDPDRSGRDPVNHSAAQIFSEELCRRLGILPISAAEGLLTIATAEAPEALALPLRVAEVLSGRQAEIVIATRSELERAIDRVFRAPTPASLPSPRSTERSRLGELLVATNLITQSQLTEALRIQGRTGGRIGEVLLHSGLVSEENVASVLAEQLRFPLVDVSTLKPDPGALSLVPEILARRHRFVPIAIHDHVLYLAMADPLDDTALAQLRRHTRLPIRTLIGSRRAVEQLLERTYAERYVRVATAELLNRSPAESAYRVLTRPQAAVLLAILTVFLLFLARTPIATLIAFNAATTFFYISFSLYKFKLISDALGHKFELPVSAEEIAALDERELPIITIIVPLYREAAVVRKLVKSIANLDYPRQKLDVKLVTEEDDDETREALQTLDLAPHFKVLVVPDAQPKTKPKACNYALIQAEGKYVVIYDAEDQPEPDQLKKVMAAFMKAEERIVCIQCKLNYYNRDQNLLTRWFTIEYSSWFDLFMPGLDAANSPIPLGGTSNFLDREKLIELGAWDPFNVTEDADLGIRLHRAGYKTAIVDSTTFEEANSDLYNWIRQRSRWVKGYIQTWLVHMRHPIKLQRQIGWRSWWSFQFVIAGTFVGFLINPLYWLLTTLWIATHAGFIRALFPSFIYFSAAFGLFIGNFVFTYVNVAGTVRRGYPELVKYALLSPLYWALMSVGAYKGFFQLFYRPFYWEKTVHGLDARNADE